MTPARALEIASSFDLRSLPADFYANPYPVYDELRSTQPVRAMPDGSWFLTRYADLTAVYRDAGTFSSDKKIEVIGNLLGVPHADRGPLRGWSLAILGALEPALSPEQEARGNRSVTDYQGDSQALEPHLDSAVDEFLRFESSNQLGNRRATTACTVGNIQLPAGALVTLCIAAANRDPAQFERADQLDLWRRDNRHLAFGFGIHQCAGLSLARLEGRIAIGRFLARFPHYRLTAVPLRGGRARFRGFLNAPFSTR